MIKIRIYQLISAILFAFSISIMGGEFSPVKAQANDSEQFFNEGREEFEQESDRLLQPDKSGSELRLPATNETPSTLEEREEETSTVEEITEESPAPNEGLGLDENLPDQPDNEQIKIRF